MSAGLLGMGGMGRVTAVYDQQLAREVARKEILLRDTHRDPGLRARFQREIRITASLEHPNIVPILDAGTNPDGEPYYTMPLVRGRTLGTAITAAADLDERLALLNHFRDVCGAMAYVHSRGVVHRDLKPANIMVGEFGETLVMDWGLATTPADPDRAAHVGTPHFMAPEQARGEGATPAADVHAMGAMLWTLLAGRVPWADDPTDVVLARRQRGEKPDVGLPNQAPAELLAIIEKATAPDPAARYPTARELLVDMDAWLNGRRVDAHDYSLRELLSRLWQQYRTPLLSAAIALVVIAGVIAVATRRIVTERDRAVAAERATSDALARSDEERLRLITAEAEQSLRDGDPARAEALAVDGLAIGESPRLLGVLTATQAMPPVAALGSFALPTCRLRIMTHDGRGLLCATPTALHYHVRQPEGGFAPTPTWSQTVAAATTFSRPEGIVSVTHDGVVQLHAWATGAPLWSRAAGIPRSTRPFFTADRTWLSVAGWTGWVDTARREARTVETCRTVLSETPLDDGSLLILCADGSRQHVHPGGQVDNHPAVGETNPQINVVRAIGPERLLLGTTAGELFEADRFGTLDGRPSPTPLRAIRYITPVNERWFAVSGDGGIGLVRRAAPTFVVQVLAGSPAHQIIESPEEGVIWGLGQELRRWRLPDTSPPLHVLTSEFAGLSNGVFHPDGTEVAFNRGDGHVVRVGWPAGEPRTLHRVSKADNVVKGGTYSQDGTTYSAATAAPVDMLTSIRLATGERIPPAIGQARRIVRLGKQLVVGRYSTTMAVHTGDTTQTVVFPAPGDFVDIEVDFDHERMVVLRNTGEIRLGTEPTLDGLRLIRNEPDATAVAIGFADDGLLLGWTTAEQATFDRFGAGPAVTTERTGSKIFELALSRDNRLAAVALANGNIRLFDTQSAALTARLIGHTQRAIDVAFHPTRPELMSASWDSTGRRWDLRPLTTLPTRADVDARWGLVMLGSPDDE